MFIIVLISNINFGPNLSERIPARKAIKKERRLKELTTRPMDIGSAPKCFAYKGINGKIIPYLKKNKK